LGLFPGKDLADNKYSGNVVDICPVGALTDRDFRFQVRVWYLDTAKSICRGCARGCNIDVHVNRRRPHHAEGRRVARLKPRFNADVNKWWICDHGRYGFGFVDDPDRVGQPAQRDGSGLPVVDTERVAAGKELAADGKEFAEVGWDEAIAAVTAALRRFRPAEIGV